jgi:hypothetical protein
LSSANFVILFTSIFAKFSASLTFSALTAISKSSAKAIALVRLPNSRLSNVLYWMFQNPGPVLIVFIVHYTVNTFVFCP